MKLLNTLHLINPRVPGKCQSNPLRQTVVLGRLARTRGEARGTLRRTYSDFMRWAGILLLGVAACVLGACRTTLVRTVESPPSAPGVLWIATDRSDLPIPGSSCRLYLIPGLAVPIAVRNTTS